MKQQQKYAVSQSQWSRNAARGIVHEETDESIPILHLPPRDKSKPAEASKVYGAFVEFMKQISIQTAKPMTVPAYGQVILTMHDGQVRYIETTTKEKVE